MTYGHLRADCLYTGPAPGPTLGIEYGKPLPLPFLALGMLNSCFIQNWISCCTVPFFKNFVSYFGSPRYCHVWCVLGASSAIIHSRDHHRAIQGPETVHGWCGRQAWETTINAACVGAHGKVRYAHPLSATLSANFSGKERFNFVFWMCYRFILQSMGWRRWKRRTLVVLLSYESHHNYGMMIVMTMVLLLLANVFFLFSTYRKILTIICTILTSGTPLKEGCIICVNY